MAPRSEASYGNGNGAVVVAFKVGDGYRGRRDLESRDGIVAWWQYMRMDNSLCYRRYTAIGDTTFIWLAGRESRHNLVWQCRSGTGGVIQECDPVCPDQECRIIYWGPTKAWLLGYEQQNSRLHREC